MVPPASATTKTRRVTLDWMLIVVIAMSAALVLGSTIRVGDDATARDGLRAGGLRLLGADERLVAFQDFDFAAPGWTPDTRQAPGNGDSPALGPFAGGSVRHVLPDAGGPVLRRFDLALSGDWSETGLMITLGDRAARLAADGTLTPVEGRPMPEMRAERLAGDTVRLRVSLQGAGDAPLSLSRVDSDTGDATWTLDNYIAVARPET